MEKIHSEDHQMSFRTLPLPTLNTLPNADLLTAGQMLPVFLAKLVCLKASRLQEFQNISVIFIFKKKF